MSLREQLLAIVDAKRASWAPEDLELAVRIGEDLATLYARKVTGEDVEQELQVAEASAKNLAAAAAVTGAQALREALHAVLGGLLERLSPLRLS